VPVRGEAGLTEAMKRLGDAGIVVEEIALRRPTLDEVFLNLTTNGGANGEKAA